MLVRFLKKWRPFIRHLLRHKSFGEWSIKMPRIVVFFMESRSSTSPLAPQRARRLAPVLTAAENKIGITLSDWSDQYIHTHLYSSTKLKVKVILTYQSILSRNCCLIFFSHAFSQLVSQSISSVDSTAFCSTIIFTPLMMVTFSIFSSLGVIQ